TLIWLLAVSFLNLSFFPGTSTGALLPSQDPFVESLPEFNRMAAMEDIQLTLESRLVAQRLSDLGLTTEEVMERMNRLSDRDIHRVAGNLDALHPGGDALGALIFLLVVGVIIVVALQMSGHKVIITK
ncbi:MAG TPA: PA2779 family protein, partial [Nitrospiria bacterium]|nr:PA2779 family protein [Nitrospiria bacterium]